MFASILRNGRGARSSYLTRRLRIILSGGFTLALLVTSIIVSQYVKAQQPAQPFSCPQCDLRTKNFASTDLTDANLTGAKLQGVNLKGLTMNGAQLQGAQLQGAQLDNALLNASTKGPADLTNADLTSATFTMAQLGGTKLQFVTLSNTDFSNTDISTATFGPTLKLQPGVSRTRFQSTQMNCEFIAQWKELDLSNANINSCWKFLSGVDFTGAVMPGVAMTSGDPNNATDLRTTLWSGAILTGASFTSGRLDNADFSSTISTPPTILTGADFSYVSAPGAKFDYANLSANSSPTTPQPGARLNFAYLANATFTHAQLQFTDFSNTILTGTNMGALGFATLDGAKFKGANLSGLDLSTVISALGIDFSNANLSNVNFKNVDMGANTFKACDTKTTVTSDLTGSFLCGSTFDSTILNCANITAAVALTSPSTFLLSRPGSSTQKGVANTSRRSAQSKSNLFATATATCAPLIRINVKTNGIPPAGLGCFTTCPDGSPGPCATDLRWQFGGVPPAPPCCTAKPGGPPCKPQKRPTFPCTTDCDCISKQCTSGKCA